jgi:primosomal protein N' (replication factor Y)
VLLALASPVADQPLTYRVPEALGALAGVGMRAIVPLGSRTAHGVIVSVHGCDGAAARPLRDLLDIPDPQPAFSGTLLALARRVAEDTGSSLGDAVRCLIPPEMSRRTPAPPGRPQIVSLNRDRVPPRCGRRQQAILAALDAAAGRLPLADLVRDGGKVSLRRLMAAGVVRVEDAPASAVRGPAAAGRPAAAPFEAPGPVTLLLGDPDARRRWIIDAVAAMLRSGMRSLLTVPETALVPALAGPLQERWSGRVAEFHSAMPASLRLATWGRLLAGGVDVVVGTRSALFAPLDRLGLIIVDEEQDPSYKADGAPRYHARAVAVARGELERARVVLGSSAPSLEAFAAAADGRVRVVRLPFSGPRPRVTIVDTRSEQGRGGILARPLVEAIRRHLRGGGRIALFVSRVGYARVLVCRECGSALRCPRCEIPMPYDGDTRTIQCRVCGTVAPAPDVCPRCKGVALRWAGAGTARVLEVARRLFPAVRTARLDRETERGFDTVAAEFASGRIRLVVGTRLLLRGRRLRPTLIGAVDADSPLYRPDFRAAERAFQDLQAMIELAAGPAAEAVIQTRVPEHPVMAALRTGREDSLYRDELRVRREFGYPPYVHLARVIATSRDRETAHRLVDQAAAIARGCGVDVLGPAPMMRPGGRTRSQVQCLLRSSDAEKVKAAARAALDRAVLVRGSRLVLDMDPQEMY